MKHFRNLLILCLCLGATCAATAQEQPLLTATMDFPFTAQNTRLPAGAYTVSLLSPFNILKVQSADGRHVALLAPITRSDARTLEPQPKLVFVRLGGQYFLSNIVDLQYARQVPLDKVLREEVRRGRPAPTRTILAKAGRP